jgi:hypothetical protein
MKALKSLMKAECQPVEEGLKSLCRRFPHHLDMSGGMKEALQDDAKKGLQTYLVLRIKEK